MELTIYTDASYCNTTDISTYAYYVEGIDCSFAKTSVIPRKGFGIHYYEMFAIAKSLVDCKEKFGNKLTKVNVFTDSQISVNVVRGKAKVKDTELHNLAQNTLNYLKDNNIQLNIKHVKGHNKDVLNCFCDREARKLLRKTIKNATENNKNMAI